MVWWVHQCGGGMYRVREAGPGRGLGVFAAAALPVGTLVMREQPLLSLDRDTVEREVARLQQVPSLLSQELI